MSIAYSIDDQIVAVSVHGISEYEEVRRAFDEIASTLNSAMPARILFDARHTDYAPPSEELGALAEHLGATEAYRGSRWAIVAPPNSHMFGVCRIFCSYAEYEGLRVETFSSYNAARTWLNNPSPDDFVDLLA